MKHKPLDYEYDTVKNSAPYTVSAFNHLNKYHMTSKSVRSHYLFSPTVPIIVALQSHYCDQRHGSIIHWRIVLKIKEDKRGGGAGTDP